MKFFLFICATFIAHSTFSQQVIDLSNESVPQASKLFYTAGGEPFVAAKFVNLVEGSPYFKDEWMPAVVVDKAGNKYKSPAVRLDLLKNAIHHLDSTGRELILVTPLREIVFVDKDQHQYRFVNASYFPQAAHAPKEEWFLALCSGKVSLYKEFKKILREEMPFASATTEQRIFTSYSYLIFHDNAFVEIRKIKDLPSLLPDKKKELQAFLKEKSLADISMDERFTAVIAYYNSLTKASE